MIEQKAADVYFEIDDAILNEAFPGFKEDYLVLHSLIRRYKPKTFFEIGTNMGTGTNIICNAMYNHETETVKVVFHPEFSDMKVYSLDLPTELAHISLQHPISEGKGDKVGSQCTFPYTQLRGDSLTFDFSQYPCEGYFIDGEHDYKHPYHETLKVLANYPKIIIWHDADIPQVGRAIKDTINGNNEDFKWSDGKHEYQLYRVTDTRIAYALRKTWNQ